MRWLVRLIGSVLVLIFLLGLMVVLMPKDRVAQMAADRFASATGRKLTIEGSVRPSIWPVLGVKTGPVRLANADWGKVVSETGWKVAGMAFSRFLL